MKNDNTYAVCLAMRCESHFAAAFAASSSDAIVVVNLCCCRLVLLRLSLPEKSRCRLAVDVLCAPMHLPMRLAHSIHDECGVQKSDLDLRLRFWLVGGWCVSGWWVGTVLPFCGAVKCVFLAVTNTPGQTLWQVAASAASRLGKQRLIGRSSQATQASVCTAGCSKQKALGATHSRGWFFVCRFARQRVRACGVL